LKHELVPINTVIYLWKWRQWRIFSQIICRNDAERMQKECRTVFIRRWTIIYKPIFADVKDNKTGNARRW